MTTFFDISPNVSEPWSKRRYKRRLEAAQLMAWSFGVSVTSGVRTEVPTGGSSTSLHDKGRGGLAFDFGGPDATAKEEENLCQWANTHRGLFQEIMHHDTGGGLHAHIAFRAFLLGVRWRVRRKLRQNAAKFGGKRP